MNNLFYYPSFEVEREDWLKFALLYIGKLKPIVPINERPRLSSQTRLLLDETDLLDFHHPSSEEAYRASLDAFTVIESLLKSPERYFRTFHTRRISDVFRDTNTHTSTLFQEKYTYEFERFCLDEGLATDTNRGILMSDELINIYMTLLANIISENNHTSAVTDSNEMEKYNVLLRRSPSPSANRINIAKSTINLALPTNLENISLETIIQLRNNNDFRAMIDSFHRELDAYITSLENNNYDENFVEHLNRNLFDIRSELAQLGPNLFSFSLGFWFVFNGSVDFKDVFGTALIGGAVTASVSKISRQLRNNRDARFTRKYLATLGKIPF